MASVRHTIASAKARLPATGRGHDTHDPQGREAGSNHRSGRTRSADRTRDTGRPAEDASRQMRLLRAAPSERRCDAGMAEAGCGRGARKGRPRLLWGEDRPRRAVQQSDRSCGRAALRRAAPRRAAPAQGLLLGAGRGPARASLPKRQSPPGPAALANQSPRPSARTAARIATQGTPRRGNRRPRRRGNAAACGRPGRDRPDPRDRRAPPSGTPPGPPATGSV